MSIYNINLFGQVNLEPLKKYLELDEVETSEDRIEDEIRKLCIIRLCKSLGIKCQFNLRNKYFYIFACIVGEAVCQKLGYRYHLVDDKIRLFRYNGVNYIDKVRSFLDFETVEEAFIDSFNFLDENKEKILKILDN